MSDSPNTHHGNAPVRTSAKGGQGKQTGSGMPASFPPAQSQAGQETRINSAVPHSGAQPAGNPRGAKPVGGQGGHPRPATATAGAGAAKVEDTAPRRIRLVLSRVDPWSIMKLSFLLSIAIGIATVVATAVVWGVLNSMGVFAKVQSLIQDIGAMKEFGSVLEYVEFARVISVSTVVAVINVVLLTALCTLGAFLYNLVAAMVGGVHVTLTDE